MKLQWLLAALGAVVLLVGGSLIAAEKLDGVKCVVSGKPVKADAAVDYKGGKLYFCCPGCPKAFDKDTAKFAAKANHQLVATGQAKQEKCPITGKALNPATKIQVAGVDVCFCCNGCKGKANKAEGDAQVNLVFGDKAFEKGFKVAAN